MQQQKHKGEIFRHLRPLWFNKGSAVVSPRPNGGISFLFLPTEVSGTYNYWICECPDNAAFSAKQAVASLRRAVTRGTVPFGVVVLSPDEAILDTAVKSVIREEAALPSKVAQRAFKILLKNLSTTRLHHMYVENMPKAKEIYDKID